ncbi:hypothetical protein Daudx_0009 [Candidatus Desulforudis audaxviator]|nr:hypothetical protein Daudx_0009 [Candidatus Desulforudis audaxviator]
MLRSVDTPGRDTLETALAAGPVFFWVRCLGPPDLVFRTALV